MYGDIDAGLINSWLAVQWSELQQLLSSPLPGHWYTAAMIKLLDAAMASPVPLPRDAMMVVERQAQRFEALITQLTRTPSDRQHALSFFAKLVQSGYRRKMELMEIMLTT